MNPRIETRWSQRASLAQRIPPPFPLAGSIAWLRPEPGRDSVEKVKIHQHDARDGTVFVTACERPPALEPATGTRRVRLAELAESKEAAMLPLTVKKPRRRKSK